ncbi:hypothetical protein ASF53_15260 [Methylobacterium sp. Leaf123]|uniref:hypothetical protein n=1 Tax=Methylobacterium sp. Leaf123 TaxID=1736264 RepID=UPI0006FB3B44|nr:hypothetical protein [Methylobacterium sp. Leaf123]KQQ12022.1 hypothetical protein ASF53_15260 [Methylobacterium sp. Leaf123]
MTKDTAKPKPTKLGAQKLTPDDGLTQSERFIKAAQELGTDDDPERFAERVRKLTGRKKDAER